MTSDQKLILDAIEASGYSARAFAQLIETDERTVRRWQSGERPMLGPAVALCFLITELPKQLIPRLERRLKAQK